MSVTLKDQLSAIGENAFAGATNLKTIDLSNTVVETIEANAFKDATMLTTVTLPSTATLKTIGNNAFTNSGLNTLGNKLSGNTTTLTANKVELPASVTTLGTSVFSNSGVVNVDLSKPTSTTMNTLPASTFEGAENLVSVTLKDQLSAIGENAFKNAANLKTVTTPNQNTLRAVVGNKVQFGNNLKTIGNNAFGNSGITEVALSGSGLTEIGTNVFSNASQLKTVNLPTSLKTIKNGAFNNDPTLSTVNFSSLSSLETIEDNNFSNSAISEVDLSSSASLKGLNGENLFTNMSQLTTVKIPSSFNTLNDQSQLTNSTGGSISDKVFTNQKGSSQVKLTPTATSFTLATGTTSIQQSEFFKEYTGTNGTLDLSKSSALTTIKQNTFNNPSISKLMLPGDKNISFDLGNNVTETTQAKDVAPIYYDFATANGKSDSLKEISYNAKDATKKTSSRNKRDTQSQDVAATQQQKTTLSVPTQALQTIVNVMNTYSGGPQQGTSDNVPNLSKWEVKKDSSTSTKGKNSEPWIENDLTIDEGKKWYSSSTGTPTTPPTTPPTWNTDTVDITTTTTTTTIKPWDPAEHTTLFKKHNGIVWKLTYDNGSNSITLQTTTAKLYKASSTNSITKTTENKQVYFSEVPSWVRPQQPSKFMTIKVVMQVK